MPRISMLDTGETYQCRDGETVLAGMERLGRAGIPVGCRGGGCGVCKIRVISGEYDGRKMSRACITREEEEAGLVLACRVVPRFDLQVEIVGGMRKCIMKHAPHHDQ
ncbi:ferredoxin [Novosphingobium nitrogenifigens DSM 19370]|uniref:Ferredoxin n=1 Tax=Novosphingobium nitrogenifigens DSM 19370 TaxID=983920 RepID=F1ZC26_9SPHN|nr:2Fe-2S iron-sulfur cluster-binding protein [Novosphingobium nitrogenifigens]EGD57837.1 ferredoxin [Novosphingobium nitrogenifigens DSM 19370]